MPKSYNPHSTTTSRRKLLAAAPAALALSGAAAAPAAPNPDADLIAYCAAFDALEHKLSDAFADITTDAEQDAADAITVAVGEEQAPILDAICARPPSTPAGAAAVAHSLALWDTELFRAGEAFRVPGERLVAVLVRGLMGSAAA